MFRISFVVSALWRVNACRASGAPYTVVYTKSVINKSNMTTSMANFFIVSFLVLHCAIGSLCSTNTENATALIAVGSNENADKPFKIDLTCKWFDSNGICAVCLCLSRMLCSHVLYTSETWDDETLIHLRFRRLFFVSGRPFVHGHITSMKGNSIQN